MGNDAWKEFRSLVEKFKEAGLVLEIAKAPMRTGQGNEQIFQLDIPRKLHGNTRKEWFRIWPGVDVSMIVQNINKGLQQLVLMVKEEERFFTDAQWLTFRAWSRLDPKPKIGDRQRGAKILAIRAGDSDFRYREVVYQYKTTEGKRHYLLGVDERQLFICQLPRGCSTVEDAHRALKRTELITAEGKAPGKTIRQGEWFFVHPTTDELKCLNELVRARPYLIHKKRALGPGGHPHRADEVVVVPGKLLVHGWPIRDNDMYVRGSVIHVDHAPVRFATWRKVIRNNEVGGAAAPTMRGGIFWVD